MDDKSATQLLERLATDIPVGVAPIGALVREGRRARRSRFRRAWAAAGAVVAVVAVPTALVAGWPTEQTSPDATADAAIERALADYDPSRMPELLLARSYAAFSKAYPDLPEGVFAAQDEWNDTLPTRHYDKASWMSVDYRATAVQALRVWVGHDVDPSSAPLAERCSGFVDSGIYVSCDVVDVDGRQAMSSIALVTWQGDGPGRPHENLAGNRGTPLHHRPSELDDLDPSTIWFEHAVAVSHAGGHRTVVTESVKATTLEGAEALFRVNTRDLATLAADPQLVIPRPPLAANGCAWSLKHHGQVCVSSDDVATAEALVRQKADEYDAVLTSATLGVSMGVVENPNTGSDSCSSGKLLRIQLIGDFPGVVTTGYAPDLTGASPATDNTVRGVSVVADASSGQACMVSAQLGTVVPSPADMPLRLP